MVTGVPLEMLDNTFIEMIKASVDKPLPITVYNYKSMTTRYEREEHRIDWNYQISACSIAVSGGREEGQRGLVRVHDVSLCVAAPWLVGAEGRFGWNVTFCRSFKNVDKLRGRTTIFSLESTNVG